MMYPCCCGAALHYNEGEEVPKCTNPACDHYSFREDEPFRWYRIPSITGQLEVGLFHVNQYGHPIIRIRLKAGI